MKKYVRVDWPESQEWMWSDDVIVATSEDNVIYTFVPEELYRTEGLRHKISALLNGTSEEHPHECEITIGESDACGLSSLELPTVIACFEMEGDGTIWFMIDGVGDWTDFDDMELEDLEKIYNELNNE